MKTTAAMPGSLLDVNVLVALAWPSHRDHLRALAWFRSPARKRWHTCIFTQSAFVRLSMNPAVTPNHVGAEVAVTMLAKMTAHLDHHPLAEMPDLTATGFSRVWPLVRNHADSTDAALLCIARHHHAKLATLDQGLAALSPWPDAVECIV